MTMKIDMSQIGQGRQFNDATQAYDAQAGKQFDAVAVMPTDVKLPTQQLPMAPAPAPFVIKGG